MLHPDRLFSEPTPVPTAEALAEKLTQHTWTLCSAFQLEDLLLLNDSTSEDGAGEWAIIRNGHQVESITFSWCTEQEALTYLRRLQSGVLGTPLTPITPLFHPSRRPCAACA